MTYQTVRAIDLQDGDRILHLGLVVPAEFVVVGEPDTVTVTSGCREYTFLHSDLLKIVARA